jgi:hypothetical protein
MQIDELQRAARRGIAYAHTPSAPEFEGLCMPQLQLNGSITPPTPQHVPSKPLDSGLRQEMIFNVARGMLCLTWFSTATSS